MFSLRAAVLLMLAIPGVAMSGTRESSVHPELWPRASSPSAVTAHESEVERRLAAMSVREKVGQTIQADIGGIRPSELKDWPIGSILVGGDSGPHRDEHATPEAWLSLMKVYQKASPVPLLIGIDAVHGHNNVVGAVLYPHHVGLGAARDPELVRRIEEATAEEVAATGMNWNFAPTLAVPRDARWGRTYEGYSSDPAVVASYAAPAIRGIQGDLGDGPLAVGRVAGTAKHFLGDGGTHRGKDQGDTKVSEEELIAVHAAGYAPAIDAGVLTVMASFSSWNGKKMHGNRALLTDVLKGRMGFLGLVVGDWDGHAQLPGCKVDDCPDALNAGVDLYMVPFAWKKLYQSTLEHVASGEIPMARLDDAVRRVLRVKAKLGLFDAREIPDLSVIASPAHRALAREAVRKSAVLLKNDGTLPISSKSRILVTGPAADDIGAACGGWTITWQGKWNTNRDFPNGQSIGAAIREATGAEVTSDGSFTVRPDVAIVVLAEPPYAEGKGDLRDLAYKDEAGLRMLRDLRARGIKTVTVFLSGRPRGVDGEIAASDAFVAAFLPGTEGGGLADLLIGEGTTDFHGKLPYAWPGKPAFPLGHGLTYR